MLGFSCVRASLPAVFFDVVPYDASVKVVSAPRINHARSPCRTASLAHGGR
jgi:hypothetical protein